MVTREEAIKLIRKYEPVLFLHPKEPCIPVHPGRFMEHSGLWSAQPYRTPDKQHSRTNWKKIINKGTLTLNPAKHNQPIGSFPDEGWRLALNPYLETSDKKISGTDILIYPGITDTFWKNPQEGYLFLNCAGWIDEQARQIDIEKGKVLFSTLPSLADGRYEYRYFAKVLDFNSLQKILLNIKDLMAGQPWVSSLLSFFDQKWVIWYYFFFPFHEEGNAGKSTFEGDWTCVAVVVEKPFMEKEEPRYIGLSTRTRGNCPEKLTYLQPMVDVIAEPMQLFWQKMDVIPWDSVTKAPGTLHPKVYVSQGSHNLYISPGTHNLRQIPILSKSCETTGDIDQKATDLVDSASDAFDSAKDTIVGITKGFAIPFPFNLIAMLCEYSRPGVLSGGETPADTAKEQTPIEGDWGCIIKPAGIDRKLLFDTSDIQRWGWDAANQDGKLSSLNIRDWSGNDDEILVREVDIWWPASDGNAGYQGLWGAVVQDDPYESRSGMPFPAFETAFLVGLGTNILSL